MHVQGRKLENPSRQTYENIISLSETMIINILVSINPDIFLYTCFLTQITSYLSYYFITLFLVNNLFLSTLVSFHFIWYPNYILISKKIFFKANLLKLVLVQNCSLTWLLWPLVSSNSFVRMLTSKGTRPTVLQNVSVSHFTFTSCASVCLAPSICCKLSYI